MRCRKSEIPGLASAQPSKARQNGASAPGAFGFKTAFDEDYSPYSPGFLLERAFLAGRKDFGIGWCDSCAAADHDVMNRIWSERRRIGRVSIAIGGPLRRAAFSQLLRKEAAGLNTEVHA